MTMTIEQDQNVEKSQNTRLIVLSTVFIGSLGAATLCSMMGRPGWAMGLGLIGICSRQPDIISIDYSSVHHHIPDVKQAHAMLKSASLCFARSKPKQKSCYLTGMKGIKGIGQKLFCRG